MTDADAGMRDEVRPPDGTEPVVRGVPRHLGLFLGQLADLTPEGRRYALDTIGPGSRLVLEALGLLEVDTNDLTERGEDAVRALAEQAEAEDEGEAGKGSGDATVIAINRIASVTARTPELAALAGNEPRRTRETYDLREDLPGAAELGPPVASVLVVRDDTDLAMWQVSGRRAVVLRATAAPLPRLEAGEPALLPNTEDEPPTTVLRRELGVTVDE